MTWRIHFLILIALVNFSSTKEQTKKALIIAVDELKPEESDAIISDVRIKDQRSFQASENGEESHPTRILHRAPVNKQLEYIIVRPEDLKAIKNLDHVTIDEPKVVRYPDTNSDESYDANSRYSPYSHSSERNSGAVSKYPSRPAPPLTTYSGGDGSNEEHANDDPSYADKKYSTYDSPDDRPYRAAVLVSAPKVVTGGVNPGSGYSAYSPSSYSVPPGYSSHGSSYGHSKPSTYSGTSSYSAPGISFGISKPSSFSDDSYGTRRPFSYSFHGGSQPSGYSVPYSYSHPASYKPNPSIHSGPSTQGSQKPSSYYRPSTYDSQKTNRYSGSSNYNGPKSGSYSGTSPNDGSKPGIYSAPSVYDSPKPDSYQSPPSYGSKRPSSYSAPSVYDSPKPDSYQSPPSYESKRPSSYSGPSTYDSPAPSGYIVPSTYEKSKSNSYSGHPSDVPSKHQSYSEPSSYESTDPHTHSNSENYYSPENSYSKSVPSSHSSTSSYSGPGSSYSSSKPPSYSGASGYSGSSSPHDSSAEHVHPDSEKYSSYPENQGYPEKTYVYDEYDPPKTTSYTSGRGKDTQYNSKKPYKSDHYDGSAVSGPRVTHVLYDDLPSPYKSPDHETNYEHPDSKHEDTDNESPKSSYRGSSKPKSYDTQYHSESPKTYHSSHLPDRDIHHHSVPSSTSTYGEKVYDEDHNSKSTYSSSPDTDSYHSSPRRPYSKKPSYSKLKTSYRTTHEPSSYDDPNSSYAPYKYPASKVTYESPSYSNHPRQTPSKYNHPSSINDDAKYKSSHVLPNYDDKSTHKSHSNLEYGTRNPGSYRKSRHTDSDNPVKSHFTVDDVKSKDVENHSSKKSKSVSSDSHYPHYADSAEIPDYHSAKKNYSPVRPAPSQDELETPRYPPLPRRSKNGKKYHDSEEALSKESIENYKHNPVYKNSESYDPHTYSSKHGGDTYTPSHPHSKETYYPGSGENHNYHYSDHSSEERGEPLVYTKTTTTTYTKPYNDPSIEHVYEPENPEKPSYKASTSTSNRKRKYRLKKDSVGSQSQISRPQYKDSQKSPAQLHTYSYKAQGNNSTPVTYKSLSELVPPKRVPGVVYRSRHSYPKVKSSRKSKGYLPYKPLYPKTISAYDQKPIESMPSEIRENNVTSDSSFYDLPKPRKLTRRHRKKHTLSKDTLREDNDKSNHDAIPGEPDKDYPVLKEIPYNTFSCENKLPGFYADVENRCQVYYQCNEDGRMQSFLCPNGTIFNQLTFVCEWWHNVDCSKSEKYYGMNDTLYKVPSHNPSVPRNKKSRTKYDSPKSDSYSSQESPSYYSSENERMFSRKNDR